MFCPKCGTENPNNAKTCYSCGQNLTNTTCSVQAQAAKTRALAITSFILGILSIMLLGIATLLESVVPVPVLLVPLTGITAIILGTITLVKIHKSKGTLKGKTFAKAGIFISLFIILLGFICPSLGRLPPSARKIIQKARFHSIDAALEFFASELNGYPPSDALDPTGKPYCGAMKLCEAMMGQDLMGFHPASVFRRDGMNSAGTIRLYNPDPDNLKVRKGPFLPLENTSAYQLKDIYKDVGPFDGNSYVICDVFTKKRYSSKNTGMPLLYYKADTSKTNHNIENPDDPNNIYNYKDNHALLELGVPEKPNTKHPLFANPKLFYEITKDHRITTVSRPYRTDSYVLLSAGLDGLYGTEDDIVNFETQWKPKQKGKNE
jgi:hypothetical protein